MKGHLLAVTLTLANRVRSYCVRHTTAGWEASRREDQRVVEARSYSDWHHVGLYVGGGTMIHAPQTGDVVKYAPAWRETFQFGVRPR